MANVTVVGAGAWGTALAAHAARQGHRVTLWAREPEVVDEVNAAHRNTPFLPDVPLPGTLSASADPAEAVANAEIVIMVPPSQHLRSVAGLLRTSLPPESTLVIATKGIEEGSLKLMSEVLAEVLPELPPTRLTFLSGPSFAREVAQGLPTNVVVASSDVATARRIQPLLHAPNFRVYASPDPIGVQIGASIKNVIAVAAGASDGLGFGTNARAALITRGLAEMARLGVALGADPLTFLGLAGVGDLVLTATGDLSRNRTLGLNVAQGADPKTFLAARRSVAEGFFTSAAAVALGRRRGVELPITEAVYQVLHEARPLAEAVQALMMRDFKDELYGIREVLRVELRA